MKAPSSPTGSRENQRAVNVSETSRGFRTGLEHGLSRLLGERRAITFLARVRVLLGGFRRTPLRAREPWHPAPFFIIGSGRSGTTLLRAMLSRHPEVCIPPELEVTGTLAQDFLRINALPWRSLSRLCLARIVAHHDFDAWNLDARYLFRVVAALPPARRGLDQLLACVYEEYRDVHKRSARLIGDKTPLNTLYLEWLDAMFPDACYVHVLRDGRAVVESLVRNWGDLNDEASLLKGCEIWRERVHRARRFCASRARGRSIEIRYEELVDDPGSTLVRVADLLGIDFHREMLEHRSGYAELGDTTAAHMSTLAEPLSKDRNAKWRDLSIPARDLIVTALQDDLLELGYLP